MPRRSDDSVRVGLNSMVRASSSSKLGKVSGPSMKATIAWALSPSTPGVTSTSTSRSTTSGCWSVRASAVMPPSDMPTTGIGVGASEATRVATSVAFARTFRLPLIPPSEWPWPGRSMATSGRPRAMATVSQVWAFWAPPCTSTSSGGPSPHTSALSRRPGATSTNSRRTVGGPSYGSPNSSAFSWKYENSS